MPERVDVRLSGKAKKLMNELRAQGLGEREVIARALGLLEEAYRTGRVARVDEYGQAVSYFSITDSQLEAEGSLPTPGARREQEPIRSFVDNPVGAAAETETDAAEAGWLEEPVAEAAPYRYEGEADDA